LPPERCGVRFAGSEYLATPKGVIAQGDAVDAGVHQFVVDFGRDAGTGGGVFGVGHDEIEVLLGAQSAQGLLADVPPGLAYDVTDQEDAHGFSERIHDDVISRMSLGFLANRSANFNPFFSSNSWARSSTPASQSRTF